MVNQNIRNRIAKAGLYQYQVADEIGINEVTFIRWLRKPLEPMRELLVNQAIEKLKKKKEAANNDR